MLYEPQSRVQDAPGYLLPRKGLPHSLWSLHQLEKGWWCWSASEALIEGLNLLKHSFCRVKGSRGLEVEGFRGACTARTEVEPYRFRSARHSACSRELSAVTGVNTETQRDSKTGKRVRDSGALIPRWHRVFISPHPYRFRDLWKRRQEDYKSQRWWKTPNKEYFQTQQDWRTHGCTETVIGTRQVPGSN